MCVFKPKSAGLVIFIEQALMIVQSALNDGISASGTLMNSVLAKRECQAFSVNTLTLRRNFGSAPAYPSNRKMFCCAFRCESAAAFSFSKCSGEMG